MASQEDNHPVQHIGGTVMVVMMDVDPEHEEEFNRWYDEEHLTERLEIPGYVSARRFKLEEGEGVLKYMCIWELDDSSPLKSPEYQAQTERVSELRDRVLSRVKQRARGIYTQITPVVGAFEDHSGFHPEPETAKGTRFT